MESNDDAKVWFAINWNGELSEDQAQIGASPSDAEFKEQFNEILNPNCGEEINPDLLRSNVYIPLLDDAITTYEISQEINNLKMNKSSGPDGLPPGLLRLLPAPWILHIAVLFNHIFNSAVYPASWETAKLFTVFKSGSRSLVSNYRGISVVNSLMKLYDKVLCGRLEKWFKPFREQAGRQAVRREGVVTLRLLMQFARNKKFQLFITFMDFF